MFTKILKIELPFDLQHAPFQTLRGTRYGTLYHKSRDERLLKTWLCVWNSARDFNSVFSPAQAVIFGGLEVVNETFEDKF